jgi:hypothetical protein
VTKCPKIKGKLGNEKMGLSKLRKWFFNLNFFGGGGGILSQRQVCFYEISLKFSIF